MSANTLKPEKVVAVVDTREQTPLNLHPLQVVRSTLVIGDYSILGMEKVVSVERKSIGDLLSCIGQDRRRFEKEIDRLLAFPCRALIVESSWEALESGCWRSKITPAAAMGSCIGWIARGIPIVMIGDHRRAGVFVSRLLFQAARKRLREVEALMGGAK